MSMNMNFAQPESSAESLVRMGGIVIAIAGGLTLWGLYANDNPTNWLSNVGLSVGNNNFRTLSIVGASALAIGGALYMRKGLYLIVAAMLVTLALVGHNKWYTIGNKASSHVRSAPAVRSNQNQVTRARPRHQPKLNSPFVNTRVALTATQKRWCNLDDDKDGKPNRYETSLAKKNCVTGYVHKAAGK